MRNFPPTALETKECPPHHWLIDSKKVGRCLKCRAVKQFGKHRSSYGRDPILLEKSKRGGKNSKGLSKKEEIDA